MKKIFNNLHNSINIYNIIGKIGISFWIEFDSKNLLDIFIAQWTLFLFVKHDKNALFTKTCMIAGFE